MPKLVQLSKSAVVLVLNKYNRNSIAALAGAVDVAPGLEDMDFFFFWDRDNLARRVMDLGRYERVAVGFSFATASAPRAARRLADLRRSLEGAIPTPLLMAGGPHATGDPQGTLDLGFDLAFRGEAEESFPQLLRAWRHGQPWENVPGLAFRHGSQVMLTRPAPPVDIEHYPPFSVRHGRWGFIEISRGCPWACRYCQTSHATGGRMRHRSVDHIVRAIEEAMTAGFSYARFITPNAFAYGSPDGRTPNLPALEELLRRVSQLMGPEETYLGSFPSEVRPETVSPEAIELVCRYAGNKTILLGAQSGSPRMLERMHRGHKVEDVYHAVDVILQGGLEPTVDFIFGLPGEKEADRLATAIVVRDLASRGATIHGHVFMPLPGTAWAQEEPGRITAEVESLLGELGRQGRHFGAWGRQERLAQRQAKASR